MCNNTCFECLSLSVCVYVCVKIKKIKGHKFDLQQERSMGRVLGMGGKGENDIF